MSRNLNEAIELAKTAMKSYATERAAEKLRATVTEYLDRTSASIILPRSSDGRFVVVVFIGAKDQFRSHSIAVRGAMVVS